MENKYNTIKNTARKYVASVLVAGAIFVGNIYARNTQAQRTDNTGIEQIIETPDEKSNGAPSTCLVITVIAGALSTILGQKEIIERQKRERIEQYSYQDPIDLDYQ